MTLTGQRYGRWLVLEEAESARLRCGALMRRWKCRCACGTEKTVSQGHLVRGATNSCGCVRIEKCTKHGFARVAKKVIPEYRIWSTMRMRCFNPNQAGYAGYGGRGISVCARWDDFGNFLADMGRRPSPQHSIDRRNNDGNYEPDNCRWATPDIQSRNRRSNRLIEFRGEKRCLSDWARLLGVDATTLSYRAKMGKPLDQALHARGKSSEVRQ